MSTIHDIETRKGSAWLKRAMTHLSRTMTDQNADATLQAISISLRALEHCQ